jgi:branched-chain amino acid transport system substrate-binding protein
MITIVLITAIGLSACGEQKEETIRIGLIAPLKGEQAAFGQSALNAATMAIKEVSAAGGLDIGGHKVKIVLVIEDDQGLPETAALAAQKLINQENVVALVGPLLDRNAIPVSVAAQSARIPMISPTSTDRQTTANKSYVFRATYTNDFQGQVLARFAITDLGAANDQRGVAVVYDIANAYNKGIAETFKTEFEKAGGRVPVFESYTTGEKDFVRQLTRVASGVNLVVLPNYPAEVAMQVKQARAMGIFQTILGTDALAEVNPADYPDLDRLFLTAPWHPNIPNESSQAFAKAYQAAYNQPPSSAAALTYDSVRMIFKAIQTQNKADSESIKTGLAQMGLYKGVTGDIQYQGSGDPVKSVAILQIKDNEFVFFKMVNP